MGRIRADLSPVGTRPTAKRATTRPTSRGAARRASSAAADLSIEEAWRYVDRLCRAIWAHHRTDEPPQSLADVITTLRDGELVPAHESNMMHTIRSLRNLVVHESLRFGDHETTVSRAAWQIIRAWAQKQEREAWKATVAACGPRA